MGGGGERRTTHCRYIRREMGILCMLCVLGRMLGKHSVFLPFLLDLFSLFSTRSD